MGSLPNLFIVDILGVVLALLLVVYAYFKWSFNYWKRRNIPYLEPSIPFGTFSNPFNKSLSFGESVEEMYNRAKAKGLTHCGIYLMARPLYLLMDLDIVKQISTKDFSNFMDRGTYVNEKEDPLSAHLFSLSGEKWKNMRAKLSPSFTSGKMKMMFPTMIDYSNLLDKYMEQQVKRNRGPIDIKDILGGFSNDIIASVAFGLDCNSFTEPNSPFRENGKKFMSQSKLMALRSMFNQTFPNFARALGLRELPRDITDFFTKIVHDALEYRQKNNYSRNDFLQMLIDYRKNNMDKGIDALTIDELTAQCFLFWLAGFETTSSTMMFATFEMSQHPEIQDRVRKEVLEVLEKHNNKITYESLSDLKYLEQVIDETLRIYPPVTVLTRQAAEEYKIPGKDVVLEKNTIVMLPVSGIHHDEEYYKNPSVFDPDRFSEENKKKLHPMAHIPFGAGQRLCLGKRFGIMEAKVGLATLLRRYRLTLNEKTKTPLKFDPFGLVPLPLGGIWLNLKEL